MPFEAPKKASITGKKIWGRKRHALVDTQGHILAVKVTGAEVSDQQGAQQLLMPLKSRFPRMKLVWADSHYGGTMLGWIKEHLGWTVQVVRQLKEPKRGLLALEGEEIDWDKLFPKGFRPLPRRWVIERSFAQDPGAGVGSAAIMRGYRKPRKPSSSSRRAFACSTGSLPPFLRDGNQTHSKKHPG